MNTKLTLSIDEEVIQAAKDFAKKNNRSVSKLVEEYLVTLSKEKIAISKKHLDLRKNMQESSRIMNILM
jgi:hypothetical protein